MRKNPTEQTVEIVIGGETYKLVFNLEAIAAAEELTDLPLITGIRPRDVQTPKISLVRAMLWASMHTHHPDVTPKDAAALVNQWNCRTIWGDVLTVWAAGMRKPDKYAVSDPPKGQS